MVPQILLSNDVFIRLVSDGVRVYRIRFGVRVKSHSTMVFELRSFDQALRVVDRP